MSELKRTPLYPLYAPLGAKVIDFGGWELPVQFSGILQEHEAVRTRVGLFDVSHMGEFLVSGGDAQAFVQRLTTNDVARLQPGQAQYSVLCYPDGGTVDDLLVYCFSAYEYMLVVNAANIEKDLAWLLQHADGDVSIADVSSETCLLALQGPLAARVLQPLVRESLATLRPFQFLREVKLQAPAQVADSTPVHALISRTGYTGEDGFELYVTRMQAQALWQMLIAAGADYDLLPIGLGARDTLRFEARLPLYGQELAANISPLEAGLGTFVKLDQAEFIGREALITQKQLGVARKSVGIEMLERGIPRTGYPVYVGDVRVGTVTSGTQSPSTKRNVGLALLESSLAVIGTQVEVDIRGKRLRAQVVPTPFYKRPAVPVEQTNIIGG